MIWRVILLWFLGATFALADFPSHSGYLLPQTFSMNLLDQISNITRSGTFTETGATPAPATNITVNGVAALTYGDFTFARTNITLINGNNSFTNIAQNTNGVNATNILSVNLPTNVIVQYDANGNLTNDGTRVFSYDAENQLTNVFSTNLSNLWRVGFLYDGLNRRRIERDYAWTNSAWLPTNETHYIYDGNNVIQERDASNNVFVTYTRGLDLSASLRGAGGVGGLLARTDANGTTYYHTDANVNITALMDGNQNIVARYEYDGFGRLIGKWGSMADANVYRFSSKEYDPVTGLYYFGGRYYDPVLQRWLNCDPIQEAAGINLYGFVRNNPTCYVDSDGRLVEGSLAPPVLSLGTGLSTTVASATMGAIAGTVAVGGAIGTAIGYGTSQLPVYGGGRIADFYGDFIYNHFYPSDLQIQTKPILGGGGVPPRKPPCTTRSSPPFGPGDNEGAARGREAHKWWNPPPGFEPNFRFNTGDIADAVNPQTHEILELKTSELDAAKGWEQIGRYIQAAENQFGGEWTGRVVGPDGMPW
jgi:RHS repeat-associated protein